METKEKVTERLNKLINSLIESRTVYNPSDFAEQIGKNRSYLSEAMNGKRKVTPKLVEAIVARFPEVNPDWILYEEGSMFRSCVGNVENNINISHSPHSNVATNNATITQGPQVDYGDSGESELVPMLPMKLAKDPDTSVMDYIENPDRDLVLTPAVQQFPPTTCFKICNSEAMLPDVRPGDQLALAAISHDATIVNGELYAIDAKEVGLVTRYAYDKGDYIELRASNPRYEPFKVKKELIYTVFRVLGLIRSIL